MISMKLPSDDGQWISKSCIGSSSVFVGPGGCSGSLCRLRRALSSLRNNGATKKIDQKVLSVSASTMARMIAVASVVKRARMMRTDGVPTASETSGMFERRSVKFACVRVRWLTATFARQGGAVDMHFSVVELEAWGTDASMTGTGICESAPVQIELRVGSVWLSVA